MAKYSALGEMPFLDHLKELRSRTIISVLGIFVCSVVAFLIYDKMVAFLSRPFELIVASVDGSKLFINSIVEGFTTKIKLSLWAGFVLSFPIHLFNLVKFIFPGLKKKEKRVIFFSIWVSAILILSSGYYCYFKLIPISIQFLTGSGFIPKDVGLLLTYGKNIFFIFQFFLLTMLIFQTPIVLEILLIFNVVSRKLLWNYSRFIIIFIFILSAIVTPPDIVSQLSIALPLMILFFLSLFIAKIFRFGE